MCGYRKVAACIRAPTARLAPAPERRVRRYARGRDERPRPGARGGASAPTPARSTAVYPPTSPASAAARRSAGEDSVARARLLGRRAGEPWSRTTEFLNGSGRPPAPSSTAGTAARWGSRSRRTPGRRAVLVSSGEALACPLPSGLGACAPTRTRLLRQTGRWKSALRWRALSRLMSRKDARTTRGRRASSARSSRSSSTAGSGRASGARSSRAAVGAWGTSGATRRFREGPRATRPRADTGGGSGTIPPFAAAAGAVEWASTGTRFLRFPSPLAEQFLHNPRSRGQNSELHS